MRLVEVLCLFLIQYVLTVREVKAESVSPDKTYKYSESSASSICKITVVLTVCDSGNEFDRTNVPSNKLRRRTTEGLSRQIEQTLVLLKSMMITSKFSETSKQSSCVEVIILSETRKHFDLIQTQIFVTEKWDSSFTQFLKLRFVQASYPTGTEQLRNLYLPCASLRLFFADMFPEYDSVIYLDTDIILLRNIQEIWNQFRYFSKATLQGISRINSKSLRSDVNTGVILMNLTRMRNSRFTQEMVRISQKSAKKLKLGDQTVLNIYFKNRRKALYYLPCNWNYASTSCKINRLCDHKILQSEGVAALHGKGQAFHGNQVFQAPCLQEVFRLFQQVQLDRNFSLKKFVQVLLDGLCKVSSMNQTPGSCEEYGGTMLKGLEQLLQKSENETT